MENSGTVAGQGTQSRKTHLRDHAAISTPRPRTGRGGHIFFRTGDPLLRISAARFDRPAAQLTRRTSGRANESKSARLPATLVSFSHLFKSSSRGNIHCTRKDRELVHNLKPRNLRQATDDILTATGTASLHLEAAPSPRTPKILVSRYHLPSAMPAKKTRGRDSPPSGCPLPPFLGIGQNAAVHHHGKRLPRGNGGDPTDETSPSAHIRNLSGEDIEQLFASSVQRDARPPRAKLAFEVLRAQRAAQSQDEAPTNAVVDWVIILSRTEQETLHLHAVFRTSLEPTQWHYMGGSTPTTDMSTYWQLARDTLFHTVLTPGTRPKAIYLTSMPWTLPPTEADALLRSCSLWAGEAFGCSALSPARQDLLKAKSDSKIRLETLLAMAAIATNGCFLAALPSTPQWLRALTLAVGGYLPASAITPAVQGFKKLYPNGGETFNAAILWSTACILAVGAGPPQRQAVDIISGILTEQFDPKHPVHGNTNPARCLWGLVQALAHQIQGTALPREEASAENRCNRCATAVQELRPFQIPLAVDRKECTWCDREHDVTACPIIRTVIPKPCHMGSCEIIRRIHRDFSTNSLAGIRCTAIGRDGTCFDENGSCDTEDEEPDNGASLPDEASDADQDEVIIGLAPHDRFQESPPPPKSSAEPRERPSRPSERQGTLARARRKRSHERARATSRSWSSHTSTTSGSSREYSTDRDSANGRQCRTCRHSSCRCTAYEARERDRGHDDRRGTRRPDTPPSDSTDSGLGVHTRLDPGKHATGRPGKAPKAEKATKATGRTEIMRAVRESETRRAIRGSETRRSGSPPPKIPAVRTKIASPTGEATASSHLSPKITPLTSKATAASHPATNPPLPNEPTATSHLTPNPPMAVNGHEAGTRRAEEGERRISTGNTHPNPQRLNESQRTVRRGFPASGLPASARRDLRTRDRPGSPGTTQRLARSRSTRDHRGRTPPGNSDPTDRRNHARAIDQRSRTPPAADRGRPWERLGAAVLGGRVRTYNKRSQTPPAADRGRARASTNGERSRTPPASDRRRPADTPTAAGHARSRGLTRPNIGQPAKEQKETGGGTGGRTRTRGRTRSTRELSDSLEDITCEIRHRLGSATPAVQASPACKKLAQLVTNTPNIYDQETERESSDNTTSESGASTTAHSSSESETDQEQVKETAPRGINEETARPSTQEIRAYLRNSNRIVAAVAGADRRRPRPEVITLGDERQEEPTTEVLDNAGQETPAAAPAKAFTAAAKIEAPARAVTTTAQVKPTTKKAQHLTTTEEGPPAKKTVMKKTQHQMPAKETGPEEAAGRQKHRVPTDVQRKMRSYYKRHNGKQIAPLTSPSPTIRAHLEEEIYADFLFDTAMGPNTITADHINEWSANETLRHRIQVYKVGRLAETGRLSQEKYKNMNTAYVMLKIGPLGERRVPFIVTSDSNNYKAFNALGYESTNEWNLALRHCDEECPCVPRDSHVVNDLNPSVGERVILQTRPETDVLLHVAKTGAPNPFRLRVAQ